MNLYDIIFYIFAAITVLSAVITVTAKNIIYAAFSLLFTFFGIAGIYVLLGADFISIVQIIVYVGGILILLLFGVMLTNKVTTVDIKSGSVNVLFGSLGVLVFLTALISMIFRTRWNINPAEIPQTTVHALGTVLLNDYVIIFELLAVLLLIALIGAASIARRTKEETN